MSHCANGIRGKLNNTLTQQKFRYIKDKRKVSVTPKGKPLQLEVTGYCGPVRVYATSVWAETAELKSHPHELYGDGWDVQDGVLTKMLEIGEQGLCNLPLVYFHKTTRNAARGKLEARSRALDTYGIQGLFQADDSRSSYKSEEFCLVVILCWDDGTRVPIVSKPIYDKGKDDWQIDLLSAVSGPASGGTEIHLTTSTFLAGYNVVFASRDPNNPWTTSGHFGKALHRVSLLVKAPEYFDPDIQTPVDVDIYLERTVHVTDEKGVEQKRLERTDPKTWTYTPALMAGPRKRKKMENFILEDSANYEAEPRPVFPWAAVAADQCTVNGTAYHLEPAPASLDVATAGWLRLPGGETFRVVPAAGGDPSGVAIDHHVSPPVEQFPEVEERAQPELPPGTDRVDDIISMLQEDDFLRELWTFEEPAGPALPAAPADNTEIGSFLGPPDETIGTVYKNMSGAGVNAAPVMGNDPVGPSVPAPAYRISQEVVYNRDSEKAGPRNQGPRAQTGPAMHAPDQLLSMDSGNFSLPELSADDVIMGLNSSTTHGDHSSPYYDSLLTS